jgi:multidrug efflux system membrane fusion protein
MRRSTPPVPPTPGRRALHPLLACALILAGLVAAGCDGDHAAQTPGQGQPPPSVGVSTPTQRTVTIWQEYTGRLSSVETVEVRPRVSGFVEEIHFEEGSLVKAGDLLFTLDPRTFQAQVSRLRARRDEANVRLDLAHSEARRIEGLAGTRAVSEEEVDQRRRNVESTRAALAAAEADLAAAQLDLGFTQVRAPVSGRIGRARVTRGNLASGGSGDSTVLTTIVSLDPIRLEFTLDETAARKLLARAGNDGSAPPIPVEMQLRNEAGFPQRGTLEFVDNRVDAGTGTLLARGLFENPTGEMLPGMFARLRLRLDEPRPTLLVPASAIGQDQSRQIVYVVGDDDMVQAREVVTGPVIDGMQVIEDGLERADTIIVRGLSSVRPGAPVTAEPVGESQGAVSAPVATEEEPAREETEAAR